MATTGQELEAGRDLDRRVGERVMGYTIYHYDKGYTPYWVLTDEEFDPVANPPWHQRSSEAVAWSEDCPHFSTDLNAAFSVAAKIQQDFYFRFSLLGHEKGYWHAEFFGHPDPKQDSGQRWGDKYAATLALAICAAALQAHETWTAELKKEI